ncbi:MAG TPA: serine--tRNA ligase [Solirubrobacteraceae bacterium]|jgi:seryl-tRNA synthetase|nr:serine--tRNA ligase [Solirubrobacteraceae bacterium]
MLDLKLIREDTDGVRAALVRRGPDAADGLDRVIALDARRRELLPELEGLRAEQNDANSRIRSAANADVREREIAAMRGVAAKAKALEQEFGEVELELQGALAPLPNLPDPSAAPGPEDELVREVGVPPELGFTPRDHLELAGERIDMDRAANLSGTRFAYLKGDLVMLELALVRWVLEKLRDAGFEPVIPPVLVRERALYGTGFLPDTEQQIYRLPDDDLYLVGTSEVALASLHDSEIIDGERLPLRYAGFSPCFRREAGAAGKDTRGMIRVHQFDKVEMFSFVAPEQSVAEHERILAIEEQILGELELPYRVVNIAVTDLGNSAAKKYDCEAWIPSQGRYRELTSCSNTTDYQARRLNIRVRAEKRTQPLHTLNGTAVAVGRTIVALLENGQRADGGIDLPSCLELYGAPKALTPDLRGIDNK